MIKTETMSRLPNAANLQDTDLFLVGCDGGTTFKQVQWRQIKEKTPTFVTETKGISLSATQATAVSSVDITKEGYTPIAVAGWYVPGASDILPAKLLIEGTALNYSFRNISYTTGNWQKTANINVLYIKNV